ncbi:MAG: NAD(P)H-dependent oxidoreductase [Gammaproteobacteria bacterium]|mgnify:CR=1 FL=1|jgi:chromate reductase, NAD(P)H dehydrogenase (quinone)|nr:NAD(P)H-dependent oxidoreductase [Gammaproteobacteria bacterium]
MAKLIGISGSLRSGSYNTALLECASSLLPEGSTLEIKSINVIPLYNGDLEDSSGMPESVTALKQSIKAADGLLIATPEYNGSIPGVLKNTIDWLSRTGLDDLNVLNGLPVALMGATPGGMGTVNAQAAYLPIFKSLRMPLWIAGGGLMVSAAHTKFDDNGALTDELLREQLEKYLSGFIASL